VIKTFNYTLRGEQGTISLDLDSNVYNNFLFFTECPMLYCNVTGQCTNTEEAQYYLKFINEPNQTRYLDNLINSIKSKTSYQDDQARIAISLVQNIPYGGKPNITSYDNNTRFPYEVLYDDRGQCLEKSLLLAYLLRGLGYGVVLFQYPVQNHMAVGIKSPAEYANDNTGYAFVETTIPSIVTDDQEYYGDVGKLTGNPVVYKISAL
jgi:hypothetical protein